MCPRIAITVRLKETLAKSELSVDLFADWIRMMPVLADQVIIEAGFASCSTLLIVSLPVALWCYLPNNPAISVIGIVKSTNLLSDPGLPPNRNGPDSCNKKFTAYAPGTKPIASGGTTWQNPKTISDSSGTVVPKFEKIKQEHSRHDSPEVENFKSLEPGSTLKPPKSETTEESDEQKIASMRTLYKGEDVLVKYEPPEPSTYSIPTYSIPPGGSSVSYDFPQWISHSLDESNSSGVESLFSIPESTMSHEFDYGISYPLFDTSNSEHHPQKDSMKETPSTLGWRPDTHLLSLYTFVVARGREPYLELLTGFNAGVRTPKRVYLDPPKYVHAAPITPCTNVFVFKQKPKEWRIPLPISRWL